LDCAHTDRKDLPVLCTRITKARVITMDAPRPAARGELGIRHGRIVDLDEEVAGLPARRTLDLDGATVLPGFIDAHVHLAWAGWKAHAPSVAPSRRADDVLRVVTDAVTRAPTGSWVDFGGYDQRTLDRPLTAADPDAVSAGRRVRRLPPALQHQHRTAGREAVAAPVVR
jgi:predicted amidohydrolase YtcJ